MASGEVFADALTATNFLHESGYHGPVLLTPRGELAAATKQYLADVHKTVYIFGGTAAVSQHVEDEIRALGLEPSRYAGKDRYETASLTLNSTYNYEASFFGEVDGKSTVILANGEDFADALAAGPLSYAVNLPILLTQRDAIPEPTRHFMDNYPQGVEQFLLVGGTSAISEGVADQIRARGFTVKRIAGPTRQGTAVAVAELLAALTTNPTHAVLARGDTFPDALAAGTHSGAERAPIILTLDPTHLSEATGDWLSRNASTIDTLHIIGDDTAVSDAVADEAEQAAG